MKILFSAKGKDWDSELDPRFGRAQGFLLYDDEQDQLQWYGNEENKDAAHGAGIQAAQRAASLRSDFLITGHVGPKADSTLKSSGIQVFPVEEKCTIREAYNHFLADRKE
ncbi:MAG TPA: NifB/NifX family molybdenum-iron cluster-binding protein [Bacteroidales bacterium]|nr:NifB/NifX family molybdenum-iron cluster-binding protein [Bacteroidales bacterium]